MGSSDNNYNNDSMQETANSGLSPYGTSSIDADTSQHSAVSWGAVLAGTVAAAALSLVLIILGVGFGMSSISVWSGQGIGASTLGITTIIWLSLTQIIASGMGGYLAGRLRTKWVSVHSDEVYFRDTAHGFLTWALATLITATFLTSAISAMVGATAQAGATIADGAATAAISGAMVNKDAANIDGTNTPNDSMHNDPMHYFVSKLLRNDAGAANSTTTNSTDASAQNPSSKLSNTGASKASQSTEVMAIFANSFSAASLPPSDVKYAAQLVAQQTGLSLSEAEKRVAMSFATWQNNKKNAAAAAKNAAEKARKITANTALWGFVFLLIGAFSASLAATWGGRCRDN